MVLRKRRGETDRTSRNQDFYFNPDRDYDAFEPGYDEPDYEQMDYDDLNIDSSELEDSVFDEPLFDEPLYEEPNDDEFEEEPGEEKVDDLTESMHQELMLEKKKTNRQITKVMYALVSVFILMIGYIVYFDVYKGNEFINHPSNLRIAKLSDTVIRGKILSSDGTVLAETQIDAEGKEKRYYPYKNMFAHVIGTSEINKSGLELSNEFNLLSSNINPVKKSFNELKGSKSMGDSIYTTLDMQLQQTAYNALANRNGVVVAIEPSTGKVLAMVSKPDYDPNTLKLKYESIIADTTSKVLLNQATHGQFAPGSIFKVITALEYMREHPDFENYSYHCTGGINLSTGAGTAHLSCYANTYHGAEGFRSSFANSCNASFANMGISLDCSKWMTLTGELFFNKNLPTDFPTGKSQFSLTKESTEWEIGATAIGQGKTTVTPIHMAMLTSTIANGGVLMEPYLVDMVKNAEGGTVSTHKLKSVGSLMTTSEAARLSSLMQAVVTEGTATSLSNLGYSVAGKTGTAETASSGNNAWFIGFAPVERPQIAICVLVENTNESSSTVAVPIARQLFAQYVK